jgi:hypothetical protein
MFRVHPQQIEFEFLSLTFVIFIHHLANPLHNKRSERGFGVLEDPCTCLREALRRRQGGTFERLVTQFSSILQTSLEGVSRVTHKTCQKPAWQRSGSTPPWAGPFHCNS